MTRKPVSQAWKTCYRERMMDISELLNKIIKEAMKWTKKF